MTNSKRGLTGCLVLGMVASLASVGSAQLTPTRTYFGVDRPVTLKVTIPSEEKGEASVCMFAPGAKEPTAKAPVVAGEVDLANAVPGFWKGARQVQFAQLMVGEKEIGAPIVIQPLKNPSTAMLWDEGSKKAFYIDPGTGKPSVDPRGAHVAFVGNEDGSGLSGVRAYVEQHVVMTTTLGEMEFRLRPDEAPNTCWSIMELVKGGFYTDIVFHRIIGQGPRGPFMAQCGDPTGTGSGGPGYNIDFESSKLPHDFGVLSMARSTDPNTAGSQFFVCFSRGGTSFLDGNYCAFGQAVRGAEVIESLIKTEVVPNAQGEPSRPKNPPKLTSAKLVDAPPFGEGSEPVKRPEPAPAAR